MQSKNFNLTSVLPNLRFSWNDSKGVIKTSEDTVKIKLGESSFEAKNKAHYTVTVSYDLGLFRRLIPSNLLKRLAEKLLTKISLEIGYVSEEAEVNIIRADKEAAITYGAAHSALTISGEQIIRLIQQIKSGDMTPPSLVYNHHLDGFTYTSPLGEVVMLESIDLTAGRYVTIRSAMIGDRFIGDISFDVLDPLGIPEWFMTIGEEVSNLLPNPTDIL